MQLRPGRTQRRTVLLGALLFIVLAGGLYAIAPWVLPVRIIEGPMLQQAGEDAVTLIWYTTRPLSEGDCQVSVTIGPGEERSLPAETNGRRNRVRVDGLAAGQAYPYRIRLGKRTLAQATLHTNKPPGEPFSFVAFGDSGRGTQAQYRLAGRMGSPGITPDFILHVGDLIYSQGDRHRFKNRFFVPYRHLLAEINFWPTLGNHELDSFDRAEPQDGKAYFEVFELPVNGPPGLPPERDYWFDYASCRIAVIDSNEVDDTLLADHVVPWLEEVFAGSDATWKFVSLHHPPYTAGSYKPDVSIQRTLVPVFEAVGVDIVFCGHDHMYQRTHAMRGGEIVTDSAGVVYVVTGAGGARLYDALPPEQRPAYIAALENERHGFTYIQINGDELRLEQIDMDGRLIDEWTMTKKPGTPASQPNDPDAGGRNPENESP